MANRTLRLSADLHEYLLTVSLREDDVLRRLREETAELPMAGMQIAPEQGQFMALLVRILQARRTLEVGVFTGYSALSVALALPSDGCIVACDINTEWTAVARRYWREAGVAPKIDLRIGAALETLDTLIAEGQCASFDFAFIDADKVNYQGYYERALQLVRTGGLIAVDNVLWGGSVVDADDRSADTLAIRAFNDKLHRDERVAISMLPIGDGLTLACKV